MEVHDTSRLLCGLLVAVSACFAGGLVIANARKVTRAQLEQVREGMTREEVTRIVGPPDINTPWVNGFEQWSCADGLLLVDFDLYGTATRVWVEEIPPRTLTERIGNWLGL
jgi:hypothetical protein